MDTDDDTDDDVFVYEDPACRLYSGLIANQVYWFRVRAYNQSPAMGYWSAPYHYSHMGESFVPPACAMPCQRIKEPGDSHRRRRAGRANAPTRTLTFEVTLDRPGIRSR